jgi:hypothetical protein
MTICTFIHLRSKRAKTVALLDLGATENFMNLDYAKHLQMPIQCLKEPRKLYNIDGTLNQSGELQYFTDVHMQTGTQRTTLQFFLSNLGENKVILGYPWFAAFQPRIDWKRGWIDHGQLPIILRSPDAPQARFLPRQINKPCTIQTDRIYICRIVTDPKETSNNPNIPLQYRMYSRVFSEEASHEFPPSRLGPHNRTQTGSTSGTPWQTNPTLPSRANRTPIICKRTHRKRHNQTLQKPLQVAILLHQKERWQTLTGTRLPTCQSMDYMQCIPTSANP